MNKEIPEPKYPIGHSVYQLQEREMTYEGNTYLLYQLDGGNVIGHEYYVGRGESSILYHTDTYSENTNEILSGKREEELYFDLHKGLEAMNDKNKAIILVLLDGAGMEPSELEDES